MANDSGVRRVASPPRSLASPWPALLIVAAVCAAWSNSFSGPFTFDDRSSIPENPTILQIWPPEWARPPASFGETVGGRPILNLSFAVNYALDGLRVTGFHAANLAIHALAAVVLFGLVRRTLLLPRFTGRIRDRASSLATATALLWALHPLQTAAVTYIVQRAESLAGLFYLLTLYAFVRATESGGPKRWAIFSVGACALGMATKETVGTAPLMALLLDQTLISGSWREAWRSRRSLYLSLAATWLVLAAVVLPTGGRGGSVGFGSNVGAWPYLLTQAEAIVRYLGLAFWPSPLIFDYGTSTVQDLRDAWPYAILVLVLLSASLVALVRRRSVGLLGAWFFVILAPTSSIIPVATQTIAEHRMYLPLAAIIVGSVLALHHLLGRAAFALLVICAIALGFATWQRNADYRTEQSLWQDTIAKRPGNARIYTNAGQVFLAQGDPAAAMPLLRRALELDPHLVSAKINLGNAFRECGQPLEAESLLREAVADAPNDPNGYLGLGTVLVDLQRPKEAIEQYRAAMALAPEAVTIRTNLAAVLIDHGGVH